MALLHSRRRPEGEVAMPSEERPRRRPHVVNARGRSLISGRMRLIGAGPHVTTDFPGELSQLLRQPSQERHQNSGNAGNGEWHAKTPWKTVGFAWRVRQAAGVSPACSRKLDHIAGLNCVKRSSSTCGPVILVRSRPRLCGRFRRDEATPGSHFRVRPPGDSNSG